MGWNAPRVTCIVSKDNVVPSFPLLLGVVYIKDTDSIRNKCEAWERRDRMTRIHDDGVAKPEVYVMGSTPVGL